MNQTYIYIVGQADTKSNTLDAIRGQGYGVGIIADEKISLNNPSLFDRVESVNFERLDDEINRLGDLDLRSAGFICSYENYITSKARLVEYFATNGPSIETATLSTDKSLMRQAFLDTDQSITPKFSKIDSLGAAVDFVRDYGFPVIIKPTSLVKSLLVMRCDNQDELAANIEYAQRNIEKLYEKHNIYDRKAELIIEEYVLGEQYSVAAFVDAAGTPHFCPGVTSLTSAQDMKVDDNYLYRRLLPAPIDSELETEIYRVSSIGVSALKMRSSSAHIELMHGQDGVKIIEIGARTGGYRPRMYNLSYEINLAISEIAVATGEPVNVAGSFKSYSAVYELFPKSEGIFVKITGAGSTDKFTYYREVYEPGTLIGQAKNGYKAAAIIIVTSPSLDVFQELCRQAESFSVEVSS